MCNSSWRFLRPIKISALYSVACIRYAIYYIHADNILYPHAYRRRVRFACAENFLSISFIYKYIHNKLLVYSLSYTWIGQSYIRLIESRLLANWYSYTATVYPCTMSKVEAICESRERLQNKRDLFYTLYNVFDRATSFGSAIIGQ